MFLIAICDDDAEDIKRIEIIIKNYLNMAGIPYNIIEFNSGEELLEVAQKFDLILLDIIMPGLNGIQVGKKLRIKHRNAKIIYVTRYQQYFKQAVNDVHTFAYLEKPVAKEKMEAQLRDVVQLISEEREKAEVMRFEIIENTEERRFGSKIKNFEVQDIYYFEYVNRKIRLKLNSEEYYFIDKMKDLMDKMKVYNFEACHQSYLVNLKYVTGIKGYDICLENGERIPLSQKRSSDFRKKLNKFIQKNI